MKGKPTAVMFDLDSVLADTRHRWGLSPAVNPATTWDDYAAACAGDSPLMGTVMVARLLWPHHQVHIVSGSPQSSWGHRAAWLDRHGVPWDYMRLRHPSEDGMRNGDLKIGYIETVRAAGVEVLLFAEDWGRAAEDIHEHTGVPVLGVNPFYPEDALKFQQLQVDGAGGGH